MKYIVSFIIIFLYSCNSDKKQDTIKKEEKSSITINGQSIEQVKVNTALIVHEGDYVEAEGRTLIVSSSSNGGSATYNGIKYTFRDSLVIKDDDQKVVVY